ncbi:MAG: hypothetical protein AB1345_10835 [Chloroflexota bacterium]
MLEVAVEGNESLQLIPELAVGYALREKYQFDDIGWTIKWKREKG